ncbi:3-isopropylmalate dehydrogenase [Staphylococcus saprophyticus]|uniref:3-isopropylmalate dehydrogenase n=4 Tax=Staphylococcus saprophyticus TaxID=29385 RepID=LEU3_STAS1|nr:MULTISPECIES: 3-isopropylmalate dehydrogenase [Staphylococcus]Q49Z13.1 RecName: Full=3-isopropylmalate dehydrogenase; AltName: Full=3-IPM-DH; AltName: Full=Beta-IPM dehydrogenase; Short=IMDH [Staphylococcus saprophyticus subsp. saprophyticus ATCC 15305 = NCTC 7292]CRV28250.1 3-isopropylmalate dehydrogenase [Streptococcus equi subsp. equi]ASE58927.1 3-isopropylmalate dehydrogenase [Staphylococcus saprophyticus]ASF19897.1 3-isopropylmalate dehydrogenase [Staphylococcus saprophyticus]KIJ87081.
MSYKIVALPGDGIGPEILNGSLEILQQLSKEFHFEYELESHDFGGIAIDNHGKPLPDSTLNACKNADAILLGAVGGPKWTDPNNRPEQGLLGIRKALGLFANIRPTTVTNGTSHLSPIKEERVANTDFILVRELTGGIYFGEPKQLSENDALDSLTYTRDEIERIARVGFELAQKRHKKLTSVDKENVLSSSKLWRNVINEVSQSYPDVEVNHLLVDACAMHLITNPSQFDVIVTENLFGDILSDEASVIPGSLGLSPSASFSEQGPRLYEPIHGSAPDIANQDIANPFGMLLSVAMCLRESLNEDKAADKLENVIYQLIKEGKTTRDLNGNYLTSEIFNYVKENL